MKQKYKNILNKKNEEDVKIIVTNRYSPQDIEKAKKKAKDKGVSFSEFLRGILSSFLQK